MSKVLVIDDDTAMRKAISRVTALSGHTVFEAADGIEGLSVAARESPDLIVCDLLMPVMDGITAVKRIMRSTPLPILMFSSLTTDGAKATLDALDAGAA